VAKRRGNRREPDDIARARVVGRYDLAKRLAWIPIIACAWIPLQGIIPIANKLAGRHTSFTAAISVNVVISLALGAGVVTLLVNKTRLERENARLRDRCHELEAQVNRNGGT